MSDKVTLYHHGSSACAAKVRLVLEEKGVPWDSAYVDIMAGEQFAADYLALNPKAVVPTLVHGDAVIRESSVICEYVDEAFDGPALMPATPEGRARVRLWTKAVDEELHPACSALTYVVSHRHTILRQGAGSFEEFVADAGPDGLAARKLKWSYIQQGLDAPGAADKVRLYVDYLDRMEAALEGSEWLVGDAFTLADAAMAPYLNRLSALAMEPLWEDGSRPQVARWFSKVRARRSFHPAFVKWMPDDLAAEMRANGEKTWPELARLLGVTVA
ncbi:glutathione S-transferase family protein [Aurantiacibacter hainanensis]|uniref:glutathione S-transferase family protein n=1 Tax=Aurantiacibacter hainanensis TaxID=3076114 RepID=UPI0030C66AEF